MTYCCPLFTYSSLLIKTQQHACDQKTIFTVSAKYNNRTIIFQIPSTYYSYYLQYQANIIKKHTPCMCQGTFRITEKCLVPFLCMNRHSWRSIINFIQHYQVKSWFIVSRDKWINLNFPTTIYCIFCHFHITWNKTKWYIWLAYQTCDCLSICGSME